MQVLSATIDSSEGILLKVWTSRLGTDPTNEINCNKQKINYLQLLLFSNKYKKYCHSVGRPMPRKLLACGEEAIKPFDSDWRMMLVKLHPSKLLKDPSWRTTGMSLLDELSEALLPVLGHHTIRQSLLMSLS